MIDMPIILDAAQSTGEKLRQLRIQHNLTMEQFGAIFSPPISRSVVANWEANRNFPNTERLITISNHFDISTDYLLKNEIDKEIDQNNAGNDKNINILPLSKEENTYLVSLLNSNNRYDSFYLKTMNNQIWHIL